MLGPQPSRKCPFTVHVRAGHVRSLQTYPKGVRYGKSEHTNGRQLKNRVAELNRANDENRDGRLDAADLKAQLNRIEAQLELQDQQNRGIIANQRKRMVLSVVLCVIILAALAFFSWRMNEAYVNVMDACNRVNDLADTVQTSLDTLDQAQLDSMMQDLPEITAQLKKVDVDALNKVLTELPALMDTVNSLQTQVQNISNWFSSLGSVFGR